MREILFWRWRLVVALILFCGCFGVVLAQSDTEISSEVTETALVSSNTIEAKVETETYIPLGTDAFFDASVSRQASISSYGRPSYSWDFGDGSRIQWGRQIYHTFSQTGAYEVKMTFKQGELKSIFTKTVFVYDREAVLITDQPNILENIDQEAGASGMRLTKIILDADKFAISAEDKLFSLIQENLDLITDSDTLFFYTHSSLGLQVFARSWQRIPSAQRFDHLTKLWVQISTEKLDLIAKLTYPIFRNLDLPFVLLTRPEALGHVFRQTQYNNLVEDLQNRGIEFVIVDERLDVPVWLPLSSLTTYFVTNGVPSDVLYLLFSVPWLAFLIAFARQFVGISTFGVLAPLLLAMSFLVLGWGFGSVVFLAVMVVGYLTRLFFSRVTLLHIPKVSLLFGLLSLSFLLLLGLAVSFDVRLNLSLVIFPMMVMSTISEKFITFQSEAGVKHALLNIGETVLVAMLAYMFVDWGLVRDSVLAIPELVILPLLGCVWLGRFTGLRITEYFKFRSLWQKDHEQQE